MDVWNDTAATSPPCTPPRSPSDANSRLCTPPQKPWVWVGAATTSPLAPTNKWRKIGKGCPAPYMVKHLLENLEEIGANIMQEKRREESSQEALAAKRKDKLRDLMFTR